jgi:hypothetical protein
MPLYTTFPILGISYSVGVLLFIHEKNIVPALESNNATANEAWEAVLISLLSGILVCPTHMLAKHACPSVYLLGLPGKEPVWFVVSS